jgi:redox-sensitive bicupin YhaK (pirin superfamily)
MHEEMPRRSPAGNVYGFQLWVNLPAALKMSQPRYQEVTADTIPMVRRDGARVRIVAGEVDGVSGPVTDIAANPIYLDVHLDAGGAFEHPIPAGHTAVAYVFEGSGHFGLDHHNQGEQVDAVKFIIFGDGDYLKVKASTVSAVRFILIAGAPFNEPIVPYGPFVMNTPAEIQQALDDLRNGTFVKA